MKIVSNRLDSRLRGKDIFSLSLSFPRKRGSRGNTTFFYAITLIFKLIWTGNQRSMSFSKSLTYNMLTLFLVLPLLSGCGYQFRSNGQPLGLEIDSLAIPMVTSPSSSLGFEADFTRILREEFISHARVPIQPREKAQFILSGNILEVRADPLSYNIQEFTIKGNTVTNEVTRRRRLFVKMDIYLSDRRTGRIIWHEPSMEEETSFAVGIDPLVNRYNQKQALEKIARDLSKKIYLKTMERF